MPSNSLVQAPISVRAAIETRGEMFWTCGLGVRTAGEGGYTVGESYVGRDGPG
jgi:hypothetical protein